MTKTIATSLSGLVIVSALFMAGPVLAASATSTNIGQSGGGSATSTTVLSKTTIQAQCLKTAATKRDTALHTALVTFKSAQKASGGSATSTEMVAAKTAYKNAVKVARAAFAVDRKACLKK